MIVESVVLPVVAGREGDFEAVFRVAEPLLARQRGYLSHSLRRGVEDPSTYLLTVEWETLEDHTEGFRGSADYQEWRALLHGFYVAVPPVPHYRDLDENGESGATLTAFWGRCRARVPGLPEALPEAWAFGATPAHADGLLALVLDGIKTGTASSLWDYDATGDPLPREGEFSIILDGAGLPRAVIETTSIRVVPFGEVDAAHAAAEGEGDLTLAHWRAVHERYWREHSENDRGFEPDMPVVCERFRLVYTEAGAAGESSTSR